MFPKVLVAASIKPFVLSILADGPGYGYAIIQRVKQLTGGKLEWTTSTLYPVLHSLEVDGLLESYWVPSVDGPPRKYYRLTDNGARALEKEKRQWLDIHTALMQLWSPPAGPAPAVSPA